MVMAARALSFVMEVRKCILDDLKMVVEVFAKDEKR